MKKNVLILFAKYPEAGQVKTRLAKELGGEKAAHLYKRFLFDLCEAHQKKDYDLIIAFSPKTKEEAFKNLLRAYVLNEFYAQEGDDLGERMYSAFKAMCHSELRPRDDRYEKVVLIGSDLPDLGEDIVQQAFQTLNETDVVLGPTYDGGYYLIGMKRAFDIFQGISWSSPAVLKEQLGRIDEKKLSYRLLAVRRDIDTMEDLEAYLRPT